MPQDLHQTLGGHPLLTVLVGAACIMTGLSLNALFLVWLERKCSARLQRFNFWKKKLLELLSSSSWSHSSSILRSLSSLRGRSCRRTWAQRMHSSVNMVAKKCTGSHRVMLSWFHSSCQ